MPTHFQEERRNKRNRETWKAIWSIIIKKTFTMYTFQNINDSIYELLLFCFFQRNLTEQKAENKQIHDVHRRMQHLHEQTTRVVKQIQSNIHTHIYMLPHATHLHKAPSWSNSLHSVWWKQAEDLSLLLTLLLFCLHNVTPPLSGCWLYPNPCPVTL